MSYAFFMQHALIPKPKYGDMLDMEHYLGRQHDRHKV